MFNILRKSRLEKPNISLIEKNNLLNNNYQKYPKKICEFSSLRKKRFSSENKEIKISYIIEDTRSFDGLLISLTV